MGVAALLLCSLTAGSAALLPSDTCGCSTRRVLLSRTLAALSAPALAPLRVAYAGESDEVMVGVLQVDKGTRLPALPAGSTAKVTLRVVGRNLKGALATADVPLDGLQFPVRCRPMLFICWSNAC